MTAKKKLWSPGPRFEFARRVNVIKRQQNFGTDGHPEDLIKNLQVGIYGMGCTIGWEDAIVGGNFLTGLGSRLLAVGSRLHHLLSD